MSKSILLLFIGLMLLTSCSGPSSLSTQDQALQGVKITLDPGHGDTQKYDRFRVGPTGEREEWINLRVAKYLERLLVKAGANVQMTRTKDRDISLGGRATLAKRFKSDLLVSIHHNGSGNDPEMDFPIIYFYGPASLNPASVDFAQILIDEMREDLVFEQPLAGSVYSDHLIYNSGTSILRNTIHNMPGVIGESGFFTNMAGESRLKSKAYNKLEAEVYFRAILKYFDNGAPFSEPIISDSLEYLDLSQELQFQLDDGFGGAFFNEKTLAVMQDGEPLKATWNSMAGILSVQPLETEGNQVVFQVFGRNFKGNAIHPVPFTFETPTGKSWRSEEAWGAAYHKADSVYTMFNAKTELTKEDSLHLLEASLHLYRLSLEIQIVHPKARTAEERILELLEMKQILLSIEDQTDIDLQRTRLKEYYPN